jgi:hypothetical protein
LNGGEIVSSYSELVKNFEKVRDYMRQFYVYGFKTRNDYDGKSARTYDDEKRRIESWLGEYMQFRQTPDGKNVFFSIDSRVSRNNPLYKAWKTKSFTDGDITLHFILLDILCLQVAFILAYITRHGLVSPYTNWEYMNLAIVYALVDFVVIVANKTMKNVLKRGYYKELAQTVKHVFLIVSHCQKLYYGLNFARSPNCIKYFLLSSNRRI